MVKAIGSSFPFFRKSAQVINLTYSGRRLLKEKELSLKLAVGDQDWEK